MRGITLYVSLHHSQTICMLLCPNMALEAIVDFPVVCNKISSSHRKTNNGFVEAMAGLYSIFKGGGNKNELL